MKEVIVSWSVDVSANYMLQAQLQHSNQVSECQVKRLMAAADIQWDVF